MTVKIITCSECESEFKISHNMSVRNYKLSFCVFCGSDLDDEQEVDLRDQEIGDDE